MSWINFDFTFNLNCTKTERNFLFCPYRNILTVLTSFLFSHLAALANGTLKKRWKRWMFWNMFLFEEHLFEKNRAIACYSRVIQNFLHNTDVLIYTTDPEQTNMQCKRLLAPLAKQYTKWKKKKTPVPNEWIKFKYTIAPYLDSEWAIFVTL